MSLLACAMLPLLLLTIFWQWNDPDGPLWMLLYAFPALLTALAIKDRYTRWAWPGAALYFAGFLFLLRHYDPSVAWIDVEALREAGGLFICATWMALLGWAWLRTRPA